MKLDKTEIARRQLGAALALFLEDSDPVSLHTLACAGCEIAEYLTHKAGEKPFSAHVLATFPDLNIGEIRQLQNQYWNAFKHARTRGGIEREDSELLERFLYQGNAMIELRVPSQGPSPRTGPISGNRYMLKRQ